MFIRKRKLNKLSYLLASAAAKALLLMSLLALILLSQVGSFIKKIIEDVET
jgi:hypothetical protein